MSKRQFLILSADGSRAHLRVVDREGLGRHLEEASTHASSGGWDPNFLREVPSDAYGSVNPGEWSEVDELILEVMVVVPVPVTTKWTI